MASQTEICNRALTKLGAQRILTITDNVKAARELNSMWDSVRDAELRRNVWNFAVTRATLAALADPPPHGFLNQFQLPADFLRVVQIGESIYVPNLVDYRTMPDAPYQIESSASGANVIVTDYGAPLKIRYVKRVEDTQLWDALFVEAFASRLAFEVCEAITQSTSKKQEAWADYKQAMRDARLVDAIENPPQAPFDDAWLISRL